MAGFVGCQQVASADELKELLLKLAPATASDSCYYFMRWPHQVSGIISELEEFPSPEGQMFTSKLELRWKASRAGYDLLYLGIAHPPRNLGFQALDGQWGTVDRPAYPFPSTETRFPQGFEHQANPNIAQKLAQRYFIDTQTATVHFIALTVQNA
ncbi:MAG TPA: hypothetical protein IGS52_15105 [Oscillatoriaceae cyanobacterium M33_DOE_052]|uniref:Uncharacterized protein n=1 Tax=Planktothricoides sp. SpSt-374 TaxID=2282167 RepID=A0A7C3VKA1_9CYAN|nr:hypothetical protein [Oscillatoriaceae cyanobacterium M33_DOE_052]